MLQGVEYNKRFVLFGDVEQGDLLYSKACKNLTRSTPPYSSKLFGGFRFLKGGEL